VVGSGFAGAERQKRLKSMEAANANRIRWFLQLRQLVQFPRHFLAPRRTPSMTRRPLTDRFQWAWPRTPSMNSAPRATTRRTGNPATESPMQKSPHTPANHRNVFTTHRLPTNNPGPRHTTFEIPKFPETTKTGQMAPGIDQNYDPSTIPRTLSAPSPLPRGTKSPANLSFGERAPPPPRSVANFPFARGGSNSASTHPRIVRSSLALMERDTLLRAEPPAKENPWDSERPTIGTSPAEINGDEYAFDDRPQAPAASSSSSVHIDGAALGRWAVQHLEQVLGRPANGMTGVDPRASSPRSRVSPF
jgi:hypothetical protein